MKIKKCRLCKKDKLSFLFSLGELSFTGKFSKSNKVNEAKITGIDNNIEKIAALLRLSPKNLAPVIVTPALLAPGINANIWNSPIIKASL